MERGPAVGGGAAGVVDWVESLYLEGLHLGEAGLDPGTRAMLAEFPAKFDDPDVRGSPHPALCGMTRMGTFIEYKTKFPLSAAGYWGAAATLEAYGSRVNYAYLYWRRGEPVPEYICLGPTYSSRDGEYRGRFIPYADYAEAVAELADDLHPFEAAVLDLVRSGTATIEVAEFPPGEGAAEWAEGARVPITALAGLMCIDLHDGGAELDDGHLSGRYAHVVRRISEELPELPRLSEQLRARPGTGHALLRLVTGTHRRGAPQCGQKLVPMALAEAADPGNAGLPAWRELAVSQRVSDLVINFVSAGFACYGQWAYIEGAGAGLFENEEMAGKYHQSEAAAAAVRELLSARDRIAERGAGPGLLERVDLLARGARRDLLLSSVAMLHSLEDVGPTLWALPHRARYARSESAGRLGAALGAENAAASRLFELAYGARCLHEKLRVCHGDLHGNNMTLHRWGFPGDPAGRRPVTLYVTGPGPEDCYLLDADGFTACIIDYSRCVLGPGALQAAGAGAQWPIVARALRRHAAETVDESLLRRLELAPFGEVFDLLCAVDYIGIGASLKAVAEEAAAHDPEPGELRPFVVAPGLAAMAARVEAAGRAFLVAGLRRVAEGGAPAGTAWEAVRPVFAPWLAAARQAAGADLALADAYNFTNELAYSGTDYAKFPPWARLDEIQKRLGGLPLTAVIPRGEGPLLGAIRPKTLPEVVAEGARAELTGGT